MDKDKKKPVNRVLAEGEVTGHRHVADVGEVVEADGRRVFSTKKAARVSHEEHKTVKVPPGEHRVEKVREYDHFQEEARSVAD
jgi:hypothetical protein